MGEDERVPKGAANWKALTIGADENDGLSDPVGFFDVAKLQAQNLLADEDKTPVAKMMRPIDQIKRDTEVKAAGLRHQIEAVAVEAKEAEEIFKAVAEGDEDLIMGLLNREFGLRDFIDLQDFKSTVNTFISGREERSLNINLTDLGKATAQPTVYESTIELVFRPRIAGRAIFVDIKLGNRIGLGKAKDKSMTEVISVDVQQKSAPAKVEAKKPGLWEKLFGKK